MTSKLDLANQALTQLGAKRLTSITDGTSHAKLVNEIIDEVIQEVMIDGAFTSTIRRASLNQTSNTPAYEFTYEYQLPTNPKCLRVLEIETANGNSLQYVADYLEDQGYRIEGDKLLSDSETAKIKYIAHITDVGSYDSSLKMAIRAKLAADLAYPITGSTSLADRLYQKYERVLARAKSIDGQNGSPRKIDSNDLTIIR